MKSDSSCTLLIISSTRLYRADVDLRSSRMKEFRQTARKVGAGLGESVGSALALGGKPGGVVWIVSEDVWKESISLSTAQTGNLSPEQLGRALGFEVEPFSGITADAGAIGFQAGASQDGARTYEVVQLPRKERDAAQKLIESAGGKLGGICDLKSLFPESRDQIEDEATLLEAAARLNASAPGLPMIPPVAPPAAEMNHLGLGLALAGIVVVGCFAWGGWMKHQRATVSAQLAEIDQLNKQSADISKQIESLRKELSDLEKDEDRRKLVREQRNAMNVILKALSARRSEEVVLRGIKQDSPANLLISGLSLEAIAVDELSVLLTQSLKEIGWSAQPVQKKARRVLANGGPWEFTLSVSYGDPSQPTAIVKPLPGGDD